MVCRFTEIEYFYVCLKTEQILYVAYRLICRQQCRDYS